MNFLALLLVAPIQDANVPALDAIDHTALDSVVEKYEGEGKPGFTAAVCRDGNVIWSNGCGEASLEWGIPNDRETVFRLASTSKQFTAAAIHLLALDGKVELDEPLVKYLPEFDGLSPMPTVRQMVHHTSGIRDYLTLMSLMEYDFSGELELQEVLDVLLLQKGLNFAPGTDWNYSNSNYILMAEIVERVSGKDLATFTQERVLDPLGMADTLWLNDVDRVIQNRAWGYEPKGKGYQRSETRIEILGDGALASTVVDLAKWADLLINPPENWKPFVEAMLTGPTMSEDGDSRYGGGLMIDTVAGLARIQHGGAFAGFRCQMTHLPDQNLTAICLANNGHFDPDGITDSLLLAALGGDLSKYRKSEVAEAKVTKPDATQPAADADEPVEDKSPEARAERRALRKAKRRLPSEEEIAQIVGPYSCSELRMEFVIELSEKGRLRARKPDGSDSSIMVRRETGESITHGFAFGMKVDFDWHSDGHLLGGTLDAGRAIGMRFERAPKNEPEGSPDQD